MAREQSHGGTDTTKARTRSRVAVVATVLALLSLGAWTVSYRAKYHVWPGENNPPRIRWCGRDYDRQPNQIESLAQAEKKLGGTPKVVARVPRFDSQDLVARFTESEVRAKDPQAPGCAYLVYLKKAEDQYVPYELQGSL